MLCISFLTGKALIFAFFNPKKDLPWKEEAPAQGADTVKEWMEAHPQEYAQFAARMKTEGIGGVLKLGEDAFRLSPDFQQEVERLVTTGRFDVSSLLEHLTLSEFAENYLREKNGIHPIYPIFLNIKKALVDQ